MRTAYSAHTRHSGILPGPRADPSIRADDTRRGRLFDPDVTEDSRTRPHHHEGRVVRRWLATATRWPGRTGESDQAAGLLSPRWRDRSTHGRRWQAVRDWLCARAPWRLERSLLVSRWRRAQRQRAGASGHGRNGRHAGARARVRCRLDRHGSYRAKRLRCQLHGRTTGDVGLRLPGGGASRICRETDHRAALREGGGPFVLRRMFDRRARGDADGTASPDVLRRDHLRSACDANQLLRHWR